MGNPDEPILACYDKKSKEKEISLSKGGKLDVIIIYLNTYHMWFCTAIRKTTPIEALLMVNDKMFVIWDTCAG